MLDGEERAGIYFASFLVSFCDCAYEDKLKMQGLAVTIKKAMCFPMR